MQLNYLTTLGFYENTW